MAIAGYLSPHQFGLLRGDGNAATQGKQLPEIADMLYKAEPQFMSKLESDVRNQGFTDPISVSQQPSGSLGIQNGDHRAAVAHRLNVPLPYRYASSSHPFTREDEDRNDYWENDVRSPEESAARDRIVLGGNF